MSVISVSHLKKSFKVYDKQPGLKASLKSFFSRPERIVDAINDVSFDIAQGELIGFIGPNGAGKTTTLKCLSGLLYPTSGNISVLGYTPQDRDYSFLKKIGFILGQKNQLWWDIPPQESFLLIKAIYDIPDSRYTKLLNYFTDALDLSKLLSVPTKSLSLGQRMRCEFTAALLHSPKVVFLDEPTIGLDVVANLKIREFISDYNRRHRSTIILTSHNMADVVKLCQRVIIIDAGLVRFDGRLSELTAKYSQFKQLRISFDRPVVLREFHQSGQTISLSLPRDRVLKSASMIMDQYPVVDINIEDPPIEEIIRQVFSDNV